MPSSEYEINYIYLIVNLIIGRSFVQLEKLPSSSTRTSINLEFRPDEINDGILISTRKSFINSSFRRPPRANKTGSYLIILIPAKNSL